MSVQWPSLRAKGQVSPTSTADESIKRCSAHGEGTIGWPPRKSCAVTPYGTGEARAPCHGELAVRLCTSRSAFWCVDSRRNATGVSRHVACATARAMAPSPMAFADADAQHPRTVGRW